MSKDFENILEQVHQLTRSEQLALIASIARMFSDDEPDVLDAIDAMYFGRPYRKRRQLGDIVKELEKQKDKQFDPMVVSAFLKVLKKKGIRRFLESFKKRSGIK